MKVVRAKVLGFCMGVRRAVEMADEAISAAPAFSIYTLGPLIHNPQALASLLKRGVKILDEAELFTVLPPGGRLFEGTAVIIRAHGISPETEQMFRGQGARIIDATCPRVKASQNTARILAEQGYRIFLAGEKDHAEIKGIYGYIMAGTLTNKPVPVFASEIVCSIVGNPEDADRAACELRKIAESNAIKTALIGQTTVSEDEYRSIAEAIKKYFPDVEVKDTICGATQDRQNALKELCNTVDAVIIAGGKNSANTRRLLSIAQSCGKPAWLAESASDLNADVKAFAAVGLSAGASTPDHVIDEVERALL